jgi:hypothetical protein
MNRILPLILTLSLVVLGVAACGGSDDSDSKSDSGGADTVLTATALQQNLQSKGYGLKTSTKNQLPASIGQFAVDPAKGFKSSHYVTGQGLKEADGLSVEGVVTVLLFDDAANAEEAFKGLGGQTLNRKQVGNRIYLWGGGTSQTKPSPKFQQVVDASSSTT